MRGEMFNPSSATMMTAASYCRIVAIPLVTTGIFFSCIYQLCTLSLYVCLHWNWAIRCGLSDASPASHSSLHVNCLYAMTETQ